MRVPGTDTERHPNGVRTCTGADKQQVDLGSDLDHVFAGLAGNSLRDR
jgi:hypothetical protein